MSTRQTTETNSSRSLRKQGARLALWVVALLALSVAPALGVPIHPYVTQFDGHETPHGSLVSPTAVAVDSHGYVYSGARERSDGVYALNIFTPDGHYITHINSDRVWSLAVDPSGNVFTIGSSGVTEFMPSEYPVTAATAYVSKPIVGLAGNGLALNPVNGNIFVAEDTQIGEYDSTGAAVATYGSGVLSKAVAVAVAGSTGTVYALDNPGGAVQPTVDVLSSSDALLGSFDGSDSKAGAFLRPTDIAFDQAAEHVLVLDARKDSLINGRGLDGVIDEFDASGAFVVQTNASQTPQSVFDLEGSDTGSRLAIDNSSGATAHRLYVGDTNALGYAGGFKEAPHGVIDVFGPLVDLPDVTATAATEVGRASATLNGTVNPNGKELESCTFEYGYTLAYGQTAPCAKLDGQPISGPGEVPADSTAHTVSAALTGLQSGHAYHFRLVTKVDLGTEVGTSESEDEKFTALGPGVSGESAARIADVSAQLKAEVNPNGALSTYAFQYVSKAQFEASGFSAAASVPAGGEAVGSGSAAVPVVAQLTGLSPETTYRYRVLASSECEVATQCATEGERDENGDEIPQTFTTFAKVPSFSGCPNEATRFGTSVNLPDCRAYEQATPVYKNGVNAAGREEIIQAAAQGGKITFFAEASMPGAEGYQDGSLFLATRGGEGSWSSQGLMPPASAGPEGKVAGWSEDLSYSYVQSTSLKLESMLYQRDNSDRSLRAIAPVDAIFAAATGSGTRMVFEASKSAGFKASEPAPASGRSVYLWDQASETVTLASVLNTGLAPPEGAFAGPYDWPQSNPSAGGAARFYFTQATHVLSADGEDLFFTAAGSGKLYLRRNLGQPQSPRNGQGKCTVPTGACTIEISASKRQVPDPNGAAPAAFMEATPDGSAAFFTSPRKLTNDANTGTAGAGTDLYRYDTESEELIDIAPDAVDPNGAEVQGFLGASADGSAAYFTANGVLATNEGANGSHAALGNCHGPVSVNPATGSCNLYLWKAGGGGSGQITFLARLNAPTDVTNWRPGQTADQNDKSKGARVSADGESLLFRSIEKLSSYDNEKVLELYRYSAATGAVDCVSCNPTGVPPTGPPHLHSVETLFGLGAGSYPLVTRNLSEDGDRVFFESPDALVGSDTNGAGGCPMTNGLVSCLDVYEWEADGTGSCESDAQSGGCIYLLSSGTGSEPSYFADASSSGDDVFIYTPQPLVGQDKDQLVDVYDVRVGGGIAAQNSAPPPSCEGEGCKEGTSAPGEAPSPGSASFSGPANPKPRAHHKKKKAHHKKKQKAHHKKQKAHRNGSAHR